MDKIGKADNFCVYFSFGWIQISSEVFPTVRKPNVINYDVVFVSRYRTRAIIGRSGLEAALEYNSLWKWGKKIYKPRLIMERVRYT